MLVRMTSNEGVADSRFTRALVATFVMVVTVPLFMST